MSPRRGKKPSINTSYARCELKHVEMQSTPSSTTTSREIEYQIGLYPLEKHPSLICQEDDEGDTQETPVLCLGP